MAERRTYLVPPKFRSKPRKAQWKDDRQCKGDPNGPDCGLMASQHTGEVCVLCSRAIEHHKPGEFEFEVEARARMARARQAAGPIKYTAPIFVKGPTGFEHAFDDERTTGGLDEIDKLCLAMADES